MKAWLAYAAAALAVTLAGVLIGARLAGAQHAPAVWLAGGLAYGLQLVSFGLLAAVRDRTELFLAGWLGGMVLRFGALGAVAFWLSREPVVAREPALIGLVSFMFVLLLMEPLFLRRNSPTR